MDRIGLLRQNYESINVEVSLMQRDHNNAVRFGYSNEPDILHELKRRRLIRDSAYGMYIEALMYNNNETELQTYRLTA